MAEDAPVSLTLFGSLSSVVRTSLFFGQFKCSSELLSYLMLCVSKMPFIPPASIVRSVSGLTGKEKPASDPLSAMTPARVQKEGGSVKERMTLNLLTLGKRSPSRSRLPTARGPSERRALTRDTGSKASQHLVKSQLEPRTRTKRPEGAGFTLTLTPEAVVLLQRRNSQRLGTRHLSHGSSENPTESRRRKENLPKRLPSSSQRHSGQKRDPDSTSDLDLSTIVKISLLNDKHKYDDVEYEEEDLGLDEQVLLKCTEWLRGLENAPVTVGPGPGQSSGLKCERMQKLK